MGHSASYLQIPFLSFELPQDIHLPVLRQDGQSVIINSPGEI